MYYVVNLSQDKSDFAYISNTLIEKINESLEKWQKIILYLNKRWEYASLVCKDCQHLYKCERCDTSLAVHNNSHELKCHFCGFQKSLPLKCEKCHGINLLKVGIGTQQIEKVLTRLYPDKKIFRFDFDSVKNISQKKEALETLTQAHIIIGTKMITTGYYFSNIWLIAIILAEQELMLPFFDAEEKVFINARQLIWRARQKEVDVIVQTFIPENSCIKTLCEKNYKDFFLETLEERKLFSLPPYTEIAILEYRDVQNEKWKNFTTLLAHKLKLLDTSGEFEIISNNNARKKYNQYYHQIHIKWKDVRKILNLIKEEIIRNPRLTVAFD